MTLAQSAWTAVQKHHERLPLLEKHAPHFLVALERVMLLQATLRLAEAQAAEFGLTVAVDDKGRLYVP